MDSVFDRVMRFSDPAGRIWYGEASSTTDPATLVGKSVTVFEGDAPWSPDFRKIDAQHKVKEVLSPLAHCPIFYCVGLNYRSHMEETKLAKPAYPAIFNKGSNALAGPLEDIPVHHECLEMDYEGELCAVIGKPCKNVGADENPLDYVIGYAAGNDVSCRYWQAKERSSFQASYSKSFDNFAPIGPFLSSHRIVPDPSGLRLTTKVNGEIRQDATTDDLVFDIPSIIKFLSRGRTLEPGTVIMTGTPGGVGLARTPPVWLKDGDVVEVEIEKVGVIRNRFIIPDNDGTHM